MEEKYKIKEVSITPSLTSLIKPTTDYLGAELKNYIQDKIEKAKESKKQENLKNHMESIQEKITDSDEFHPNLQQLDMFDDWVDGVSDVDPENTELSEIWKNLLINMGKDYSDSEILMSKLKMLTPGDAATLIKLSKNNNHFNNEDQYRLKSLEKMELVEVNESFIQAIQFSFIAGFLLVLLLSLNLFSISELFNSTSDYRLFSSNGVFELGILIILPISVYLISSVQLVKRLKKGGFLIKKSRKLTWIGKSIINLGFKKESSFKNNNPEE